MSAAIRVLPSAGLREMPRREVRIDARIDAKYGELTPQERRICDFLLEHLGDLAVFSAADISRETGVSKATVSRLFRKLDFADFREVKEHTRAMRRAGTPLAAPTRTGVPGLRPSLEAHVRAERENHDRLLTVLSGGALEEATALLAGARRIVVVGLRNSYPVALHLHQQLIQARDEVRLAPQPGQAVGEELAGLTDEDAVVLIGFRRRPTTFPALADAIEQSPARCLLVGDGTARPYAAAADCWLECPIDSDGAFDSYSTAMALVSLLANGVLNRRGADGVRRISRITAAYDLLGELEDS